MYARIWKIFATGNLLTLKWYSGSSASMANQWKKLKQPSSSSIPPSRLFLSLLCFVSIFLVFSLFNTSYQINSVKNKVSYSKSCNFTDGQWIYDPSINSPRYDNSCKGIYKGWSCIGSKKSNALDIVKWRWKPYQCDLPQFDPLSFLHHFRNTNIGTSLSYICLFLFLWAVKWNEIPYNKSLYLLLCYRE